MTEIIAGNLFVFAEEKFGRCPTPSMDPRLCGVQENQCQTDLDCSGESKCCHTGCSQVCILPQFTGMNKQLLNLFVFISGCRKLLVTHYHQVLLIAASMYGNRIANLHL